MGKKSVLTPLQLLLRLYADLGPYQQHAFGSNREIICASCGDGYYTVAPGRLHPGIRHRNDCRVRDMERTLHAAGYLLPHVHPETLAQGV